MPKDIEAILEELELVPASFKRILEALVPAWTKRCEELLTKGERDFCFVWDAKVDGLRGSGVFYRRNMLRQRQIRLPPRQNVSEFVKSLRGHCYYYPMG